MNQTVTFSNPNVVHAVPVTDGVTRMSFPGFFRATVRGTNESGAKFEADVPLDGHLDGDLYLRLKQAVFPRSDLFIVLRPSPPLDGGLPELRVALRGRVERCHSLRGGAYDLRITILDYRPL